VGAIAVVFAISTVLSLLMGFVMPGVFENWDPNISEETVQIWVRNTMNITTAIAGLVAIGLGWGIWYRIKNIQH